MTYSEKLNSTHWNVYHSGTNKQYPRVIGHISGQNTFYCAERGPIKLGYFDTVANAMKAIDHEFNRPLNFDECNQWNSR